MRATWPPLAIVLSVALIARLGYWLLVMPAAYRGLVVDEPEYFGGAVVFASGRGLSFWDTFLWTRTPLNPITLGSVFRLFGHDDLWPARLLQLGLSLASVAVLYLIARRCFADARVALISGLLAALYLPFIILPYLLLGETLFILLLGLCFLAIIGGGSQRIRFSGVGDDSQRIRFNGAAEAADVGAQIHRALPTRQRVRFSGAAETADDAPSESLSQRERFGEGEVRPTPTPEATEPAAPINLSLRQRFGAGEARPAIYLAIAGLMLGLATLVRGTTLVYIPLAAFARWWHMRADQRISFSGAADTTDDAPSESLSPRERFGEGEARPTPTPQAVHNTPNSNLKPQTSNLIALFLLAALLPIGVWTVRNYAAYGHLIPTDTTGGYNFWLGANRVRDGARLAGDLLAIPNQGARQDYAYARGFELLRADPLGFAGKGLKEMNDLWAGNFTAEERLTRGYTHGLVPAAHLFASILLDDTLYLLLVPLAIVGLLAAPRDPLRVYALGWVATNFALAFIFFAVTRFRLAVLFFLLPYAAWALLNLPTLWRGMRGGWQEGWRQEVGGGRDKSRPYKVIIGAGAIVLFLIANLPTYPLNETVQGVSAWGYQQHLVAGDKLLVAGDLAGAKQEYQQADINLPETLINLASLDLRKGDTEAVSHDLEMGKLVLSEDYWGYYLIQGGLDRLNGKDPSSNFGHRVVRADYTTASEWAWTHFPVTSRCSVLVGDEGQSMGVIRGFGLSESDALGSYRWSGQPSVSLRLCKLAGAARLTLRLRGYRPSPLPSPVINVRVAGVAVGSITSSGDWGTYTISVPAEVMSKVGEETVVELSSNTFVSGGSDPRLLGFMLAEARWEPAK